jgi:Phage integrase family
MVVKVKLKGLRLQPAKGKWYVYPRNGGPALISGFEGTREQLLARLAEHDMLTVYNAQRRRDLNRIYADGTLGALVAWYRTDCPKYDGLAEATKADYGKAFAWLEPEFDCPLDLITTPSLYEVRDRCAKHKWPRFADKMISALSSMFSQAVKRGKMLSNPCLGMDKGHQADPNANREWFAEEFATVIDLAPLEIKIPLMLARYAGMRGQTIVAVTWKQYVDHTLTGKAFRFLPAKTAKTNTLTIVPAMPELQAFLAGLKVRTPDGPVALRDDGIPWASEKDMQTRVSHWLRDRERDGLIGAGTTLHGLRVSYAAWLSRSGADTGEVAAALGDKSERMGKHYTRHVEAEASVIRAFTKAADKDKP